MRQSAKFNKKKKINIDFGHTKIDLKKKKNAFFHFVMLFIPIINVLYYNRIIAYKYMDHS